MKQQKPKLDKNINPSDLTDYYWLRSELAECCKQLGLPTIGLKRDLIQRLKDFLTTGKITKCATKTVKHFDSEQQLTLSTPVVNYKNDAVTKAFFQKHIGNHFHFNQYLRQFRNKTPNEFGQLTYADLIKGWHEFENQKAQGKHSDIDQQFEYNRFIKDFFANENNKTQADAISAWNTIKQYKGKRNYTQWCALKK